MPVLYNSFNQGATPITLELAKDTTRIKKHISSVIDRVSKGSRISDEKNKLEAPSLVDFKMDSDSEEDETPPNVKNFIYLVLFELTWLRLYT